MDKEINERIMLESNGKLTHPGFMVTSPSAKFQFKVKDTDKEMIELKN